MRVTFQKIIHFFADSKGLGVGLLGIGLVTLTISLLYDSIVSSFICLGMTLWGAIFLFAKPASFIRSDVLVIIIRTYYQNIEKIMYDLHCKDKGFYIAPLPRMANVPKYLSGLRDTIVYIPSEKNVDVIMPSLDILAEKRSIDPKNGGIALIPIGSELINKFKNELRPELAEPKDLYPMISKIIAEDLRLATKVEVNFQSDKLFVNIRESIFSDFYIRKDMSRSLYSIGCPVISMIACAMAINTGKVVAIEVKEISLDGKLIQICFSSY